MSLEITILDEKQETKQIAFEALNDYEVRQALLAQVIRCELMNERSSIAHTKNRGEVRGGGKKPWKQKGTGRARHGSIRSPLWVGGGVTFGPRNERNWHRKINSSARLSALKSILKDRLNHNAVYQLPVTFDYPKTKQAVEIVNKLSEVTKLKSKRLMVIYTTVDKPNLAGFPNTEVQMINAFHLKIHKLANAESYILTPKALEILESRISA